MSISNQWLLILLILPSLLMGAPTTDITSITEETDLVSTESIQKDSPTTESIQKDSLTTESSIVQDEIQQIITTSIPALMIQHDTPHHDDVPEDLMPETVFGMQVERDETNKIDDEKLTTIAPASVSETERTSESPSVMVTDAPPVEHNATSVKNVAVPVVLNNSPPSIGDYLRDDIQEEAIKEVMMDEIQSIPVDEKTVTSEVSEVSSLIQTTVAPIVLNDPPSSIGDYLNNGIQEEAIKNESTPADEKGVTSLWHQTTVASLVMMDETLTPDLDVTDTPLGHASGLFSSALHQDPEEIMLMDDPSSVTDNPFIYVTNVDGLSTESSEEIATVKPLELVQIYDPSEHPEATTYLAEANYEQTEPTDVITTDNLDSFIQESETEEPTTPWPEEESTESTTDSSSTSINVKQSSPTRRQPRPSANKRSYDGYKVYRVILPTEEAVKLVLSMEDEPGIEFWADPRLLLRPRGLFVTSAADVMVAPQIVPQIEQVFRDARLTFSILLDDVQQAISKENPSGPSFARSQVNSPSGTHRLTWDRYHRLSDINSFLDYLREAHPDWIEVMPIGKSSQGRPIHVVKVSSNGRSNSQNSAAAATNKKLKKAILIDAGVHGNEWITPAALTWMVNELVGSAADDYQCILERFDWYFIPMLNPDGYEYSHVTDRLWRKNRRNETHPTIRGRKKRVDDGNEECIGVDLNSNFEFNWKKGNSINPCSPAYAGRKPFSEPESKALANFMLKLRPNLAMYISLHSYSQMWLLPWGFTQARPEDFSQLYSLAKVGARALQSVYNTSYLIGSVPDLLAIASGTSQDWAKGVAGVEYSYTLEMRDAGEKGMILPAQQIIPTAQETWTGIYAAAQELAHRLYPYSPSCAI